METDTWPAAPSGQPLYAEERQHAIAALVNRRGRVAVTALAEEFAVTTETVRRDLDVLERSGMLRRVHGGAVPVGALALVETGYGERTGQYAAEKARVAEAALNLLPGTAGSIILDGGSTTAALADRLPADRRLLAVTNAVPIAARLTSAAGVDVHVLGGRIRGLTQCAVGESATRALADLRVDVAFLGTNGISPDHGFTTPDDAEATVKRAMVRAGQRVVVLADSTKLGRESLVRFAALEDVDVLVTDDGADERAVGSLQDAGIEVVIA